jgi:hypothetical protein
MLVLQSRGGSDSPQESSSTSTVEVGQADRETVLDAVSSLRPDSPAGFAPEVYAAVEDPQQILPTGATVVPVPESLVADGDFAMMDAVVSAPGAADLRYWLFLERRDGVWVVTGTLELSE